MEPGAEQNPEASNAVMLKQRKYAGDGAGGTGIVLAVHVNVGVEPTGSVVPAAGPMNVARPDCAKAAADNTRMSERRFFIIGVFLFRFF
jgi:hypothetical protein